MSTDQFLYITAIILLGYSTFFATWIAVLRLAYGCAEKSLNLPYVITIVTSILATVTSSVVVFLVGRIVHNNEEIFFFYWFFLVCGLPAILMPFRNEYGSSVGLRQWLRNYADEHDTPRGEFCKYIAEVWRSFVSFIVVVVTAFYCYAYLAPLFMS